MTEYKYHLSRDSKKDLCPNCGKKTFTPYVYASSQEVVDPQQFGRCDRLNNCGINVHPNDDENFKPDGEQFKKPPIQEVVEQIFPPREVVERLTKRTKTAVSPLHQFCRSKTIPNEHMLKWGVYSDDQKTAFLFINSDQKVCNIKTFQYLENGHRDKSINAFSLRQPNPPHTPPNKSNSAENAEKKVVKKYLLCGFGEHLLDPEKKKTVCIVESEKSAMMAAFCYPQFDWLACGSAEGLGTPSGVRGDFKIKSLFGRKIYWIADADKAGRWNASIRLLKKYDQNFTIIDLFPDRTDGYDIGDAIEDGTRPDIQEPEEDYNDQVDEQLTKSAFDLFKLPDDVEMMDVQDDLIRYNHFMHENRIHITRKMKGGKEEGFDYYTTTISNFKIKPLGLVLSAENPRRLIEVSNVFKHTKVLQIPTKAFVSTTEFTTFIESEGNFQYDGVGTDLKKIRSRLYDKMESFEEVETLGWHPTGVFIWANGIHHQGKFFPIDKYGFVEHMKKNFFIEFNSCLHDTNHEDFEDERKFNFNDQSKVTLKEWSALYIDVHKKNGMVSMAWFMASLFRDFIYRQFKFFPHLFLFGPPGTGKSQVGWSIRSLGFDGIKKPFNLSGGTKVSFHREFSHFTNFPCWFDEYDNNIDYDRVQSLKAAYDGAGHKKSVKDSDKRTKTVPVNSSCLISGQQLPVADNALFKRCILAEFQQMEYTPLEKEIFRNLQDMEEGGLSHLTMKMICIRKVIETRFMETFDKVLAEFTERSLEVRNDMEDRMVRNLAIPCTVYKLMHETFGEELPFTYDELAKVAVKSMTDQMALIAGANETNAFWDMVEFLIDQTLIEEKVDFKFVDKQVVKIYADTKTVDKDLGETKELIYVRMTRIIPLYKENFKRQSSGSAAPMDKGSLMHYLQHQKYFIGMGRSIPFDTPTQDYEEGKSHVKKRAVSSCMIFDYKLMDQMGIELKRGSSEENKANEPDSKSEIDDLQF
ncbi:MAG: hypothetical protein JXR07_20380 [Reichenbachiella sp.]